MTGPTENEGEADDVTLWSGRLRATPLTPSGSTVTAPHTFPEPPGDETAVSARRMTGAGAAADEATQPTRRALRSGDTVQPIRSALPLEDTTQSTSRALPPEDTTQPTRRALPPGAATHIPERSLPLEDTTVPARRTRPADEAAIPLVEATPPPDATVPARRTPQPDADVGTAAPPRRQRRTTPASGEGAVNDGRRAVSPRATPGQRYAPRSEQPARGIRSPVTRGPAAKEARAARPQRRRAAVRLTMLLAAVVVLVALAAAGVALLL